MTKTNINYDDGINGNHFESIENTHFLKKRLLKIK